MNLNIIINQGDLLEKIPIIRAPLNFSDRKDEEFSAFRSTLVSSGIGGWFYKGYFWALPVNDSLNIPVTKSICSELFSKQIEWEETIIEEFDPDTWFHLGISLVRDSLTFSLKKKFEGIHNMKIFTKHPAFTVFDKEKVAYSGTTAFVWTGLAIDKIVPVDHNNIGICPHLDYNVFEDNGWLVIDRTTRQRCLYQARRCNLDAFKSRFQYMFDRVFPISATLSNKKLLFNNQLDISVAT